MIQTDQEVEILAQRWGQPRFIEEQINIAPGVEESMVRDFFSERWSEVVMVIRRAIDGLVWVMTKEGFPKRLYSLPTGGVRYQERISAALWRELQEETGFEAQLQRFIAVIRYVPVLAPDDHLRVPGFFSYVFLLEEPSGDDPSVSGGEKILDFKAVAPGDLLELARQWRNLSGSSSEFHDLAAWGRFRSVVHQVVGDALINGGI
jgi:8-oxo-dGTP pyrophosphatase MutT (NUDIX family)